MVVQSKVEPQKIVFTIQDVGLKPNPLSCHFSNFDLSFEVAIKILTSFIKKHTIDQENVQRNKIKEKADVAIR